MCCAPSVCQSCPAVVWFWLTVSLSVSAVQLVAASCHLAVEGAQEAATGDVFFPSPFSLSSCAAACSLQMPGCSWNQPLCLHGPAVNLSREWPSFSSRSWCFLLPLAVYVSKVVQLALMVQNLSVVFEQRFCTSLHVSCSFPDGLFFPFCNLSLFA